MKRIAFSIIGIPKEELIRILDSNLNTKFIFLCKESNHELNLLKQKYKHVDMVEYDFEGKRNVSTTPNRKYHEIVKCVLNDSNTALFLDRLGYKKQFGIGVANFYRYVSNIVEYHIDLVRKHELDLIVFRSTPHTITSWVFFKVVQQLGLIAIVQEPKPLYWRLKFIVYQNEQRKTFNLPIKLTQTNIKEDNELLNEYIRRIEDTYDVAMPSYEKQRHEKYQGKLYSFKLDVINWWRRPDFILSKYLNYRKYISLVEPYDKKEKYIVFFLHYQPEQTTLPEGYEFTQQIIAIKSLRSVLPKDYTIYVKEHPAIFRHQCDPKWRHPSFYSDISDIPNVKLLDLTLDNFDLIDRAKAVATITGTVGIEALIRGVPVIYFGIAPLEKSTGLHRFSTVDSLARFLKHEIEVLNKQEIKISAKNALRKSFEHTVSLDKNDLKFYDDRERLNAHYSALKHIDWQKIA